MTLRPLAVYLRRLIWLGILPLILVAVGIAFLSVYHQEKEREKAANDLVRNAFIQVENYLDSRIRALSILAVSPLVDDPDQWETLYEEAQGFRESFDSHVVFAGLGKPMPMLFNTRVPFGETLPPVPVPKGNAAAARALETGRPAVGDSFEGPVANQRLVAIAVPSIRNGIITKLMIATLEARQVQRNISGIALPKGWILTVVDGQGDIIARQVPEGFAPPQVSQAIKRFSRESELSPWTLTLEIPNVVFIRPLLTTMSMLLLAILIATAIGMLGGTLAARRIGRQLAELVTFGPINASPTNISEIADAQKVLRDSSAMLRDSEARHRELFKSNPQPMWVYDLETLRFLEVNDAAVLKYGYRQEEFLKMTIKDIRPPEDVPKLQAIIENISEEMESPSVWRHYTKGGKLLYVEISSHILMFEGRRAELVLAHDITERKLVEDAVRKSEAEFRILIETMPQIVWITRPDGYHIQYNQHWMEFTGLTLEESLGSGWNPAFHPDDRARAAEVWFQATRSGEPYEIEYRLRRFDGVYHWMLGRAVPLRDSEGQIVKWFGTCTDIHEIKRTEERLHEAQSIGKMGDWEYDVATEKTTWSPETFRILGRDPLLGPPKDFQELALLFDEADRRLLKEKVGLAIRSGEYQEYELRVPRSENSMVFVQAKAVPRMSEDGEVISLYGTVQDITARKLSEYALQRRNQQQILITNLGRLALSTGDLDSVFEETASAIAKGLQVKYSSVIMFVPGDGAFVLRAGSGWKAGWQGCKLDSNINMFKKDYISHVSVFKWPAETRYEPRFTPDQLLSEHAIYTGIDVLIGEFDNPFGILGAYQSVSHEFTNDDIGFLQSLANTLGAAIERRRADELHTYMAQHDALTSLPNRLLLSERLNMALAQAKRSGNIAAALFLDLDRFKNVNDVFGHSLGDQVLHEVSTRLTHSVRAMDTVARLGGDEFVVVLPEIGTEQDVARVAEKLLASLTSPFFLEGTEVVLGVSIGIACFPENGADAETLLRNADVAMYAAKEQGRNRAQFYSERMNVRADERLALENDLRHAIDRKQLFLHYQPQINISTGKVAGFEALVRWQHPEKGLISPAEFIPIAEDSGLIVEIGTWVLNTACKQQAAWALEGLTVETMAVNVSAHQFRQHEFCTTVESALLDSGLESHLLELEVTESVVMQKLDEVQQKLEDLAAIGVKLSIDDFGTGYSSLSYLKRFPLDRLKIDKSFIDGLSDDPGSNAIAKAIIQMGHSLGLDVLAEGVESKAQESYLRYLGCDSVQGYLYAKPMSSDDCMEYVRSRS